MRRAEGDGPLIRHVRRLAAGYGYRIYSESHEGASRPLPPSWEAFHRTLKKSMKDNVNNYVNRLRREGHDERLVVVEDPAELDATLDTCFELHRRRAEADLGVDHFDYFAAPESRRFFRAVAPRLLERGKIWLCLLYVDGTPVAAQVCSAPRRARLHVLLWLRPGVGTLWCDAGPQPSLYRAGHSARIS